MEFVTAVVGGDDVQQQDVLGLGIQPRHAELHLREHLPVNRSARQVSAIPAIGQSGHKTAAEPVAGQGTGGSSATQRGEGERR